MKPPMDSSTKTTKTQRWNPHHVTIAAKKISIKTHFFTRVLFWKLTYCGDCEPYLETHSKGQLNSEWINEIIVSSKNTEISGSWMSYMSAIKVNPQNSNGFLENVVFVYSMTNCIKSKCMTQSSLVLEPPWSKKWQKQVPVIILIWGIL